MHLADNWDHAFHIWCPCGHSTTLRWDAIARPELTQREAMDRLRCSRCGRRGDALVRVGWVRPPSRS